MAPSDVFTQLTTIFAPKQKTSPVEQNIQSTCAFMLFLLTSALSMAYFVTFKTYHTALAKLDSLKDLLSNPNARVATKEQGARIMDMVNKHQETMNAVQESNDTNSIVRKLGASNNNYNQ